MYCKECGKEIIDNSKFCSFCGAKQDIVEPTIKEQVADVIIQNEIVKRIKEDYIDNYYQQFFKKVLGYYLAWVLIHLTFLLIFSACWNCNNSDGLDDFWPFDRFTQLKRYDITEFIVYTVFPIIILFIIALVKKENNTTKQNIT